MHTNDELLSHLIWANRSPTTQSTNIKSCELWRKQESEEEEEEEPMSTAQTGEGRWTQKQWGSWRTSPECVTLISCLKSSGATSSRSGLLFTRTVRTRGGAPRWWNFFGLPQGLFTETGSVGMSHSQNVTSILRCKNGLEGEKNK